MTKLRLENLRCLNNRVFGKWCFVACQKQGFLMKIAKMTSLPSTHKNKHCAHQTPEDDAKLTKWRVALQQNHGLPKAGFLVFFEDYERFLPCVKSVEKCRILSWHFMTILDFFWRGPFPLTPLAIHWETLMTRLEFSRNVYPRQQNSYNSKSSSRPQNLRERMTFKEPRIKCTFGKVTIFFFCLYFYFFCEWCLWLGGGRHMLGVEFRLTLSRACLCRQFCCIQCVDWKNKFRACGVGMGGAKLVVNIASSQHQHHAAQWDSQTGKSRM